MRIPISLSLLASILFVTTTPGLRADPPFNGTIFITPNIIRESDPTAFQGLKEAGTGPRRMFDRRVNGRIEVEAFLFHASFEGGRDIEIQVNPEFEDAATALAEAEKYAAAIGRLPAVLRKDVDTVSIHKGRNPFGGGNRNILIHTGMADHYVANGILEETLVHEAAHTSLDRDHARAPRWVEAQTADGVFISTYARNFPQREDIAESYLPYFAIRFRADRIPEELIETITRTIPNRIAYFDSLELDMHPVVATAPSPAATPSEAAP